MKKRKLLSLVMAVTLTATCFIGCGSKEKSETPLLDKMDKTPITLTFFNCDLTLMCEILPSSISGRWIALDDSQQE